MYTYIYDSFLTEKKYENLLFRMEARLLELGINGRVEKLTLLKSMKEIVADAVDRNSETVVVVGNDETVSKAISFLPAHKAVLGILPMGNNNSIADILGISQGIEACDILSKRIIERIDLGKANGRYFLSRLVIQDAAHVTLDCNGFQVSTQTPDGTVEICNFSEASADDNDVFSNPQDGILEAVIRPEIKKSWWQTFNKSYNRASVFPIKKLRIRSTGENVTVLADGQTTLKTPVSIEIVPRELRVIVGKGRAFTRA